MASTKSKTHLDNETVSNRLLTIRHARGMTRKDLAKKSGINIDTIARIEAGNRQIHLLHLFPLCKALGVIAGEVISEDFSFTI